MKDKLEAYIDEHIPEFDTVELSADLWSKISLRIEARSVKMVESKLLSKAIYFGLSAIFISVTTLYFLFSKKENSHPIESADKSIEISKRFTKHAKDTEQDLNAHYKNEEKFILNNKATFTLVEEKMVGRFDSLIQRESFSLAQDSSKINISELENFLDISGTPRHIFYHISANGGQDIQRQALFWYTHKELPNTYFIIEQLCWNKWIEQGKFTGKGRPGSGMYAGKIPGKFLYKYKIPAHSGENKMRVLLMNDSNVCIAVSKELVWVNDKMHEVTYVLKKRNKEINFSAETYYELYDPVGILIKKGRAKIFSYAGFDLGTYTFNYDNRSTSIKLK